VAPQTYIILGAGHIVVPLANRYCILCSRYCVLVSVIVLGVLGIPGY